MAQLSAKELRKYDWRAEVFVRKIQEKSPFEVTGGSNVVLTMPKGGKNVLMSGSDDQLKALQFASESGAVYKLTDIVKNADFGGKGERGGTIKEDIALSSLKEQMNKAKKENQTSTVKIKIGAKTYNAYDAESTPGTPKSDFHLIDTDGKEIAWISHKDGKTEKDFQQWGGMSERSEPTIYSHKESQKFINDLKKIFPSGLPRATTIARKIKDSKLKKMSVYGNEYGNSLSRQNVTVTLQGAIELVKSGSAYKLTAYHTHLNGEDLHGGYDPVFMAIYKGDRSDFGVVGTRVVIAPAGCRKVTDYI